MTMKTLKLALCAVTMSVGFGMLANTSAMAQAAVMKECGAEWQAAKAAGTTADQTWTGYLAACRTRKAGAATTPVAVPAPAPVAVPAPVKPVPPIVAAPAPVKPLPPVVAAPAPLPPLVAAPAPGTTPVAVPKGTPGQVAEKSRIKQCGAYWDVNKVALKAQTPGLKWPQYWSSCNKQLKAAGQ